MFKQRHKTGTDVRPRVIALATAPKANVTRAEGVTSDAGEQNVARNA